MSMHDPVMLAGALGLIQCDLKTGKLNFREGVNAIKTLLQRCDHLSVETARTLPFVDQPDFDVYAGQPPARNASPAAEPVFASVF